MTTKIIDIAYSEPRIGEIEIDEDLIGDDEEVIKLFASVHPEAYDIEVLGIREVVANG